MDDTRTDETLVEAYRAGEPGALDILFTRYQDRLHYYLLTISFFKDDTHLDEIVQETQTTAFEGIKNGRFKPRGADSFRKWLYTICRFECLNQDKARRAGPVLIDGLTLAEMIGRTEDIPREDESFARIQPKFISKKSRATKRIMERIERVLIDPALLTPKLQMFLGTLSLEDQRLMEMVVSGMKYKEILLDPTFAKYSLDYLKHKICNIRKRLRKIAREDAKKI